MSTHAGDVPEAVQEFLDGMTDEQRMLVMLNRELYEGDWDEMVADLTARLEGKPYIFKLAYRIADDLERIQQLRAFEQEQDIRLGDYVTLDEG
ncbi:MAG: hypothetical protein KGY99_02550 [Phycisphaerae bacterium]|nr:hypothetical protein [Phycisphaerae bacterium]